MKLRDIFGAMAACLFVTGRETAAKSCQSTTLTFDDCESKNLKGKDYTGNEAKTKSGLTCQKWTSQSPHEHGFAKTGDHNFCRNPDGEAHLWCYTTSSSKRWDYCDVPICDKSVVIKKMNETYTACFKNPECEGCTGCEGTELSFSDCESNIKKGKDYTGNVAKTKKGLTCQKWTSQSPHKHGFAKTGDHNFCRNPDGEPHLWCYTTSSSKRWDYCDVPICGLCLLNGVCRKDKANGGTTQMKNRFDLKGTYIDWDLPAHSEETCLKRAKVFFKDCQNEDSQTVTATWVTKDGNSKHSKFPIRHEGNCYNDRSPRLMPKYQGGMTTMTPEVCNKKCAAKHFTHFGVQYSKECWCGNEAPHISKKVDPNECDDMCTGDNTRRCGGSYRANIWTVCPGHNCLFEYD